MNYQELTQKHEAECEAFPIYSNVSGGWMNGSTLDHREKANLKDLVHLKMHYFIRRTDHEAYMKMMAAHKKEFSESLEDDAFLMDALLDVLPHCEYFVTFDPEPTLMAIGLDIDALNDSRIRRIFNKARHEYINMQRLDDGRINWTRKPFYGGCTYYYDEDKNITVSGYYSPPLEFESDCKSWTASNVKGRTYETAEEAMSAAEDVWI